jgi:hypothetical protein
MLARLHVLGGEADDLAVAPDRLVLRDRQEGELVPRRDHLRDRDLAVRGLQDGARQERLLGDGDVVARVEQHGDIRHLHWSGRPT